jgi:hypothetical protein
MTISMKGDAAHMELETEIIINEEAQEETNDATAKYFKHGEKVKAVAKKRKNVWPKDSFHSKCNYCSKLFIGPGSGSFLDHVRKLHPKKCPELLTLTLKPKPIPDFLSQAKMKLPFDQQIVKTDQSFSTVDNEHFLGYANYLKSDNTIPSRRTIMRRLEEMYPQKETNRN